MDSHTDMGGWVGGWVGVECRVPSPSPSTMLYFFLYTIRSLWRKEEEGRGAPGETLGTLYNIGVLTVDVAGAEAKP